MCVVRMCNYRYEFDIRVCWVGDTGGFATHKLCCGSQSCISAVYEPMEYGILGDNLSLHVLQENIYLSLI